MRGQCFKPSYAAPAGSAASLWMAGPRHRPHHHRPGYGAWGRGFGPGGGRKASRGDIRAAILALLREEPMHGYQIIREISERSGGRWTPSPGSVYPTLQQLSDEGLVTSTETDGRRVHSLTGEGRSAAEGAPNAPWEENEADGEDLHTILRDLAFGVIGATRQIGQTGTEQQLRAAGEILRDTRRRLYRLLAEEG
jgi:DNA-binding PadR family transcriptional regulator